MNPKDIPLASAAAIAEGLKLFFSPDTYERWTVAGSVRRGKPEIGDIDHVVIPHLEPLESDDLFGTPRFVNRFWQRLDELVADPDSGVTRGSDAAGRPCWGEVKRKINYQGVGHEFYTCSPDNYGAVLAIRTGPSDLSRHLVTVIKEAGYECRDGFQVYPIAPGTPGSGGGSALIIDDEVKSRVAAAVKPIPVPEEEDFFRLARVRFVPPQDRDALSIAIARNETRQREAVLR